MQPSVSEKKRILIIYFSFSSQTNNLIHAMMKGVQKYGVEVVKERLRAEDKLRFPIGSVTGTLRMMLVTFFRKRFPINVIDPRCFGEFDLIILAGPTWSYNPSGPVLSLLDRDGRRLFEGKLLIPLISCRGYWRMHWIGLKRLLYKKGAKVINVIVFSHPAKEPWRTLGVFLKLAGRVPEKKSWFADRYRKYGHSRAQIKEAERFGEMIGEEVARGGKKIHLLNFDTPVARPL
jgi:hypothetical protein